MKTIIAQWLLSLALLICPECYQANDIFGFEPPEIRNVFGSSIIPDSNNSYDIGAYNYAWSNIYSSGTAYFNQLLGSGTATNTLAGALDATYLNLTGTTATNTFANGIQLTSGCYLMPNGTCAGSGSGSGASTALDNLASVAINESLISDTANTDNLGSFAIPWSEVYSSGTIYGNDLHIVNSIALGSGSDIDNVGLFYVDSSGNMSASGTLDVVGAITGTLTGNASTASTLAANPIDCSANQFANAIAANGNLTCAAIADADLSAITLYISNATSTLDNMIIGGSTPLAGYFTGLDSNFFRINASTDNASGTLYLDNDGSVYTSGTIQQTYQGGETTSTFYGLNIGGIGGSVASLDLVTIKPTTSGEGITITESDSNNTAIVFNGAATTGQLYIYSSGQVQFSFTSSGVVFNERGIVSNVRMESDNDAELFYLNGTTDRIGISTQNPRSLFDVGEKFYVDANGNVSASGTLVAELTNATNSNSVCYNSTTKALTYNTGDGCSSSMAMKENIKDLDIDVKKLMELRPVSYTYIDGGEKSIGLIAEEVEKVLPEIATYYKTGELSGVDYSRLSTVLLVAYQEQQREIESLKNKMSFWDKLFELFR